MPFVVVNAVRAWRLPERETDLSDRQVAVKTLAAELPEVVAFAVNTVDGDLFSGFEALQPDHVIVQFGEMSMHTVNGTDVQILVKPAELHKLESLSKDLRRGEIKRLIAEGISNCVQEHSSLTFPNLDLEVLPVACSGCHINPDGSVERSWDSNLRVLK